MDNSNRNSHLLLLLIDLSEYKQSSNLFNCDGIVLFQFQVNLFQIFGRTVLFNVLFVVSCKFKIICLCPNSLFVIHPFDHNQWCYEMCHLVLLHLICFVFLWTVKLQTYPTSFGAAVSPVLCDGFNISVNCSIDFPFEETQLFLILFLLLFLH